MRQNILQQPTREPSQAVKNALTDDIDNNPTENTKNVKKEDNPLLKTFVFIIHMSRDGQLRLRSAGSAELAPLHGADRSESSKRMSWSGVGADFFQ